VIEKAIAFSAPEWEALAGLPFLQRCLYLVLRWYMDRYSGVVGTVRGISLQSLAEELYVEPVRGRHAAECGSPSKKAIRSALDALDKAGLIQPRGNGEVLVFFLPRARRASARSKDEGHMRGTQEGHDDWHGQTQSGQGNTLYEGHDEGNTQNRDEGHTSRTRVNHPSKQAAPAAVTAVDKSPVDNSSLLVLPLQADRVAEWIRLQELTRGCRGRVSTRAAQIAGWLELAVTGEELHEAYSLAKSDREGTQNRSPINLPFLDIFVQRVVCRRRVSKGKGEKSPTSPVWWSSEAGIIAKAKALGIEGVAGEAIDRLRSRVELALMLAEDADRQTRKTRRSNGKSGQPCPI
jgi:hypothetical protein